MESIQLLKWLVFVLGFISVECSMYNVTFTNTRAQYTLQSPHFPSQSEREVNVIWAITSPPGTRVSLTCNDIRILKRVGCVEGSLTVWDGLTQYTMCSVLSSFKRDSLNNKMYVQFRLGQFGIGRFRCTASVTQSEWTGDLPPELGPGGGTKTTTCACGWSNKKRIVGGKETAVNEYIFPVSIKHPTDKQGFCGGSIITKRHILTAAHCVYDVRKPLQVVVGEHDFNTDAETNVTDIIPVTRFIMHEQYDHDEMTHDIAILVLSRDIKMSQEVGPVCLPNERYDLLDKYIKVLGWGMTSTNGRFSNVLQEVDLKVVPLQNCASRYTNKIDLVAPKQICTFGFKKDSCQGDSGGPLVIVDHTLNRIVQAALVSYGKECASADPAVNIDVHAYRSWIQKTVRDSFSPQLSICEKVH